MESCWVIDMRVLRMSYILGVICVDSVVIVLVYVSIGIWRDLFDSRWVRPWNWEEKIIKNLGIGEWRCLTTAEVLLHSIGPYVAHLSVYPHYCSVVLELAPWLSSAYLLAFFPCVLPRSLPIFSLDIHTKIFIKP